MKALAFWKAVAFDFQSRSAEQEVLVLHLPVATIEDVLNGKMAQWSPMRQSLCETSD
jgi:hypothetical protein